MSATLAQPEKSGPAQKALSEGFTAPAMIPLSGDPSTTAFLVSHTNTASGHALTCGWLLLRCLVKVMVGLLLPNQHTSISGSYAQSKEPFFYIPPQNFSSTLCQTDDRNVQDGSAREAVGSVCTPGAGDANDHTGVRRRTAAGAWGAT